MTGAVSDGGACSGAVSWSARLVGGGAGLVRRRLLGRRVLFLCCCVLSVPPRAWCARRPCRSSRPRPGRPRSARPRDQEGDAPRLRRPRRGRCAAAGLLAGGLAVHAHGAAPCPQAPLGAARLQRVAVGRRDGPRGLAARLPSAGWSLVQARAIRSVGRCSASLTSVTRTGVNAAAIQVPAIHSCEVTAAAEADATLAIVSVRVFRRRSSSRSAERGAGGMRTGQGSDVGSRGWLTRRHTRPTWWWSAPGWRASPRRGN